MRSCLLLLLLLPFVLLRCVTSRSTIYVEIIGDPACCACLKRLEYRVSWDRLLLVAVVVVAVFRLWALRSMPEYGKILNCIGIFRLAI